MIKIQTVSLAPPSLQDNTADTERLLLVLKKELKTSGVKIDFNLLPQLPHVLRKENFKIRCILFKDDDLWELVDIRSAADLSPMAGLAVDLGTTTVIVRLLDLSSGTAISETSFHNPQLSIGPDILTRAHFAARADGLARLHALLIDALNGSIQALCSDNGLPPQNIYFLSVAGNTVMTHLFLGLSPDSIIREPYIPVINRPALTKATDLGLKINPQARVFVFPNAGSYFGGDLVAGILFSGLHRKNETAILVDVGTNAEVVLGNREWLVACAGAAGPALEGGASRIGMMAGPGVIDHIDLAADGKQFHFHTIDDLPPRGFCGSGLIDLAAALFTAGMIDSRGRFVPQKCGEKLRTKDGLPYLEIVPASLAAAGSDLGISQADIESLMRSKAAMYAILETISASVGIQLKNISTFYVAGTFGSLIKPAAAIAIGMLPDLPPSRYVSLGNSSLEGAAMVFTAENIREEIDNIRNCITYLELNVNPEFMERFSAARFLPHTDPERFPSMQIRSNSSR